MFILLRRNLLWLVCLCVVSSQSVAQGNGPSNGDGGIRQELVLFQEPVSAAQITRWLSTDEIQYEAIERNGLKVFKSDEAGARLVAQIDEHSILLGVRSNLSWSLNDKGSFVEPENDWLAAIDNR